MNKKFFTSAMAVAALAVSFTSCDKSNQQPEPAASSQTAPVELKIGYVEVDSIMSQYQFCKDYTLILEKKSQNIQSTLQQKGAALQNAAANFQQQNAYTEQQARQIQAGLQKQQADLEGLQQRLGAEFQGETEKFNKALRDSIQHFLAVYNKDKKYSLILTKQGDNILYGDKALDITTQVVAGLNKAYKKTDLSKSASKDEKKK